MEQTTIHGLVEFTRFRLLGKILWLFCFVGVITFFLVGSASLVGEYLENTPMTSSRYERVEFPPFYLAPMLAETFDVINMIRSGVPKAEAEAMRYWDLDVPFDTGLTASCDYGGVLESGSSHLSRGTEEGVSSKGMNKIAYRVLNGSSGRFQIVDGFTGEPVNATLLVQASVLGVKHIFWLQGRHNAILFTGFSFECRRLASLRYGVGIGSPVHKLDRHVKGAVDLACGQKYSLYFSVEKSSRSERYCNRKQQDSEFSCVTDCLIEKAREEGRCMPFIGDSHKTSDIPICTLTQIRNTTTRNA